jgi:hypothetical protein
VEDDVRQSMLLSCLRAWRRRQGLVWYREVVRASRFFLILFYFFFFADLFPAQDGERDTREVLRDLKQDLIKNS